MQRPLGACSLKVVITEIDAEGAIQLFERPFGGVRAVLQRLRERSVVLGPQVVQKIVVEHLLDLVVIEPQRARVGAHDANK